MTIQKRTRHPWFHLGDSFDDPENAKRLISRAVICLIWVYVILVFLLMPE